MTVWFVAGSKQITEWFGGRGQGKWLTDAVCPWLPLVAHSNH